VPSVAGISHNRAEYTSPGAITAGADVLLHVVLALAGADASIETPGQVSP
jgi:acetylornithine deacetylase/succinyl-diaminopimelate desuccinylase-like protein